jgi:hypothetical protein
VIPAFELDLFGAGIFAIGAFVMVFARSVVRFLKILYGRLYGEWSARLISLWPVRAWAAIVIVVGGVNRPGFRAVFFL